MGLRQVLWLNQQPQLDRWQTRLLEPVQDLDKVRTRCPGESMHIGLLESVRHGPVIVIDLRGQLACGAHDETLGEANLHLVVAIVGKVLGAGMILMTVPTVALEDAELWKPVGDEEEFAAKPGASERARDLRTPLQLDPDRFARLDRSGKLDHHDRPVISIGVVRRGEANRPSEIDSRQLSVLQQGNPVDLGPPPVLLLDPIIQITTLPIVVLAHPCAEVVAPTVPIEMEPELIGGPFLEIAPGQDLTPSEHLRVRIQSDFDGVVGVPR